MTNLNIESTLLVASGGIITLLFIATIVIALMTRRYPNRDFTELQKRLRSWWGMAAIFVVALLVGKVTSLIMLGFLSFLAFKEYLSLIPTRRADHRVLFWAYLAIPIQYFWVGIEWYGMFIVFIPVYMFLLLPVRMVIIGEMQGFLKAAGTIHWGLMTTVFCLSHAAYLIALPGEANSNAGNGAGLLLFLIFLTELNDISQYIWGKTFGQHKIIPKVSPNKTWEGFGGGVLTTSVAALCIGPWLTPMNWQFSLIAGGLIAISGFFGDVSISALKRDLGIKDSGTILPGHGGILDRVDSLTYTAPLFLHFVRYYYY